jgi:hypothetical protein
MEPDYGCECGSDKKKFYGSQVAVVFARSGSEGLQGSGNTGRCSAVNFSYSTTVQCSNGKSLIVQERLLCFVFVPSIVEE